MEREKAPMVVSTEIFPNQLKVFRFLSKRTPARIPREESGMEAGAVLPPGSMPWAST